MVIGVHGTSGDLVLLPVAEEHVQKCDSAIILRHKTEENTVILMDLLMKYRKVVTAELVLVYKYFKYSTSVLVQ